MPEGLRKNFLERREGEVGGLPGLLGLRLNLSGSPDAQAVAEDAAQVFRLEVDLLAGETLDY